MSWIEAFGGDLEKVGAYTWMMEAADNQGRLALSLRAISRGLNWHPQKTSRFIKMLEYNGLFSDGIVTKVSQKNMSDRPDLVTADNTNVFDLFAEPDKLNEKPYRYEKPTPLPANFDLPKSWGEWAMEVHGLTRDEVIIQRDQFRGYWIDKSSTQKGKKKIWALTWRKWIASPYRKAPEQAAAETDGFMAAMRRKHGG